MSDAIARPYAKALFMLAKEQNEVKAWSLWLELVAKIGQHPLTVEMLKNPIYTKQFRLDFYHTITQEVMPTLSIEPQVKAFLSVLSEQDRVILLPEIEK